MRSEFKQKSAARLYAVQAVYVRLIRPQTSDREALSSCLVEGAVADREFLTTLFQSWQKHHDLIEEMMKQYLPERWSSDRLDTVLSAIIQVGITELASCPETDKALIITEYIDIGHAFFQQGNHKLIHAFLHAVGTHLRGGAVSKPQPEAEEAPQAQPEAEEASQAQPATKEASQAQPEAEEAPQAQPEAEEASQAQPATEEEPQA